MTDAHIAMGIGFLLGLAIGLLLGRLWKAADLRHELESTGSLYLGGKRLDARRRNERRGEPPYQRVPEFHDLVQRYN